MAPRCAIHSMRTHQCGVIARMLRHVFRIVGAVRRFLVLHKFLVPHIRRLFGLPTCNTAGFPCAAIGAGNLPAPPPSRGHTSASSPGGRRADTPFWVPRNAPMLSNPLLV